MLQVRCEDDGRVRLNLVLTFTRQTKRNDLTCRVAPGHTIRDAEFSVGFALRIWVFSPANRWEAAPLSTERVSHPNHTKSHPASDQKDHLPSPMDTQAEWRANGSTEVHQLLRI